MRVRAVHLRAVTGYVIFSIAIIGVGCYKGTCSWIAPKAEEALEVVDWRRTFAGECRCIGCRAPGKFDLSRQTYVVEFWNGDRWYPELFVRARSPEGAPLLIRSSRLDSVQAWGPGMDLYAEWDYEFGVVRMGGKVPPSGPLGTLEMEILDGSGHILGTEAVELELVTRGDWIIEGP